MSNFAYFFLILFGWLPMCLTKENSSRKECKWKNIIWITVRPFFKVLQIFQKYGSFIFLNVILFYAYLKSDTMNNISASYTAHTALTAFNISNLTTLFCLTIFTANSQRKLKSIFEKMELIKKIIGVNYLVTKPVRRTLSILKIIILISLIFDLHHIFNSSLSSLGINLTITHMLVSSLVTVYICCLASCFTSKIFKFVNIQIVSRIRITNGLLGSRDKCHDLDHHTFATVELVQINGKLSMAHRLQNELNDYIYIPVILVVYNLGVALTLGLLQFTEPSRPVHIKALIISMVASCIFLLAILCSAPDLVLMTVRDKLICTIYKLRKLYTHITYYQMT